MSQLAMNGGKPVRDVQANPWPKWPVWDENEELVLTEEYAEAMDLVGMTVKGQLAYNTHGVRGIYSDGDFYTIMNDK